MIFTKYSAVLFDKDGTIFDSETIYCHAWVETAKEYKVHFTPDMYEQFVGVRSQECYRMAAELFGDNFPMDDFILSIKQWINQKKSQDVPFKQGFQTFFTELILEQPILGLVTSSDNNAMQLTFAPYEEYLQHFSVLVTGDQVKEAKPAPEPYLLACAKLNVQPKNVLVFEDSAAGIKAGLSAGCQVAAIPDYLPIDPLLLKQCAYVFESFDEAKKVLLNTKEL
mgnify:CR=1 FL=1